MGQLVNKIKFRFADVDSKKDPIIALQMLRLAANQLLEAPRSIKYMEIGPFAAQGFKWMSYPIKAVDCNFQALMLGDPIINRWVCFVFVLFMAH